MASNSEISFAKNAQKTIFREALKTTSLKALEYDSGIPYSSLKGYAAGETMMPISAVVALTGVIDDALLSLFWEPKGRTLIATPDGVDHELMAEFCHDYLATKTAAHHPDSPGGPAISECESEKLKAKTAPLKAVTA